MRPVIGMTMTSIRVLIATRDIVVMIKCELSLLESSGVHLAGRSKSEPRFIEHHY